MQASSFKIFLVAAMLVVLLGSCANLTFYAQAVNGHMDLMRRAQPIQAVIDDSATDPELKRRLGTVIKLREFASRELGLPDNRSYTRYADLERPFAVWNVIATPELSLQLKEWCFIQAGCVNYRGFFSKSRAENYAKKLIAEGYDVYVGGVPAYSTLGWFNDPVLNTFISHSEWELARLIFHELAHQVFYVPGDTVFNESFATLVEQEGVRRWLTYNNEAHAYAEYQTRYERQAVFVTLIRHHRMLLDMLFKSDIDDVQKRIGKARIFSDLREQLNLLKTSRPGLNRFDHWFSNPVNNAQLAGISLYTQLVPSFQVLLDQQEGDMGRFFAAVKKIGKLTKDERVQVMQHLADDGNDDNLVSAF